MTTTRESPPPSWYDPPNLPELPEPDGRDRCPECGANSWTAAEDDGCGHATAWCQADRPCPTCRDGSCGACDDGLVRCEGLWLAELGILFLLVPWGLF